MLDQHSAKPFSPFSSLNEQFFIKWRGCYSFFLVSSILLSIYAVCRVFGLNLTNTMPISTIQIPLL